MVFGSFRWKGTLWIDCRSSSSVSSNMVDRGSQQGVDQPNLDCIAIAVRHFAVARLIWSRLKSVLCGCGKYGTVIKNVAGM